MFYENALIIIVDNNSKYISDIQERLAPYSNVILLTNNSECKFEIGAYKVGIQYLMEHDMMDKYEYCIFTQDNFVIKKKYNFENLLQKQSFALAINSWDTAHEDYFYGYAMTLQVLEKLNWNNSVEQISLCWCCSFVLHKSKLMEYFDMTKNLVLTIRPDSEASERFLSAILYRLNGNKKENIDGFYENVKYDCVTVDIYLTEVDHYFVKQTQHKTENTVDV
jgi:hypothetical protein